LSVKIQGSLHCKKFIGSIILQLLVVYKTITTFCEYAKNNAYLQKQGYIKQKNIICVI